MLPMYIVSQDLQSERKILNTLQYTHFPLLQLSKTNETVLTAQMQKLSAVTFLPFLHVPFSNTTCLSSLCLASQPGITARTYNPRPIV